MWRKVGKRWKEVTARRNFQYVRYNTVFCLKLKWQRCLFAGQAECSMRVLCGRTEKDTVLVVCSLISSTFAFAKCCCDHCVFKNTFIAPRHIKPSSFWVKRLPIQTLPRAATMTVSNEGRNIVNHFSPRFPTGIAHRG